MLDRVGTTPTVRSMRVSASSLTASPEPCRPLGSIGASFRAVTVLMAWPSLIVACNAMGDRTRLDDIPAPGVDVVLGGGQSPAPAGLNVAVVGS